MGGIGYMIGADEKAAAPEVTDQGQYNIQAVVRALESIYHRKEGNKLYNRDVSISAASAIALQAKKAIEGAITVRAKGLFIPDQNANRTNVRGKIDWHINRLKEIISAAVAKDPKLKDKKALTEWVKSAPYESQDDLRKWATQSFVEYNAALDGAVYAKERIGYFKEVVTQLQAISDALDKGIKDMAGGIGKGLVVGGVIVVGAGGFFLWKWLEGKKGGAKK